MVKPGSWPGLGRFTQRRLLLRLDPSPELVLREALERWLAKGDAGRGAGAAAGGAEGLGAALGVGAAAGGVSRLPHHELAGLGGVGAGCAGRST